MPQSSGLGLTMLYESPQYIGATAAYSSPFLSSSLSNATPRSLPFRLKLSLPYHLFILILSYLYHVDHDPNYIPTLQTRPVFDPIWVAIMPKLSIVNGPSVFSVGKSLLKTLLIFWKLVLTSSEGTLARQTPIFIKDPFQIFNSK